MKIIRAIAIACTVAGAAISPAMAKDNDNPIKPPIHVPPPDPRLTPVACHCPGSIIEPIIAATGCDKVAKPPKCPDRTKGGKGDK